MNTRLAELTQDALKLTEDERAALIQELLSSLDASLEADQGLALEIARRDRAADAGTAQLVSFEQALVEIRAAAK